MADELILSHLINGSDGKDLTVSGMDTKVSQPKTLETVDVFSFITTHKEKLNNVKVINLNLSAIPKGKYMLFLTEDTTDAELIMLERPDQLQLVSPEIPDQIFVEHSGTLIKSKHQRNYVLKTNCYQFILDDNGFPLEMLIVSKKDSKKQIENYKPEPIYKDAEAIRIVLRKEAVTLYNKVRDFQTLHAIKQEVVEFLATKKDILYLIKLNKILLECA